MINDWTMEVKRAEAIDILRGNPQYPNGIPATIITVTPDGVNKTKIMITDMVSES